MDYENDPAPVPGDVRDNAEAWMAAHPDVVAMFERFALDLATRGRRFGINLLRERVRWECAYEYGREPFKFCNSFSPYVARRLVDLHPHLAKHMRFRRTKYERAA